MRTVKEIEKDIQDSIVSFNKEWNRRVTLERELKAAKKQEWIAEHGVTADKVQLSEGEGVPDFLEIMEFSEWLAKHGEPKPFCEWNEMIHFTQSVIDGTQTYDMPVTIKDLENATS